ncbi:MAG: PIN domain-containing protein [Nitrospirae bacterium]|nr:PIN domain-containing protein [Nitrospirota bacterium]
MKRLFVDTGAWYAVVDKKDPDHSRAEHFLRNNKIPILTTNFVFDETVTLLRSRLGWSVAKDFGERLKKSGFVSIIAVKYEDEEKAWEIFLKYKDKDFSYTDCASFAVMERLKIDIAFTFDRHFQAMGFKAVL